LDDPRREILRWRVAGERRRDAARCALVRGVWLSSQPNSFDERDEIGSVEITAPGPYLVTVGPELPDAVEPQVLIGT